jgi:site-specific DNA recombinase
VRSALLEFEQLWNELFPAEQARIIQLLVERVDIGADGVDIRLRVDGVTSLVGELAGNSAPQPNAA